MKFEEAWHLLNLIGFQSMPNEVETIYVADNLNTEEPIYKTFKSRRHQSNRHIQTNFELVFTDKHIWKPPADLKLRDPENGRTWMLQLPSYHEPVKPYRDLKVKIKGPKLCVRCGRNGKGVEGGLQRDHKIPLHKGGTDTTDNLQWLCRICHKFKTTEDRLVAEIPLHRQGYWRRKMWEYRLETHRRLNPPGAGEFHSYGEDKKTLWDFWSIWHIGPDKKVKDSGDMKLADEQMTFDMLQAKAK